MKKGVIIIFLALTMIILFGSCGKSKDTNADDDSLVLNITIAKKAAEKFKQTDLDFSNDKDDYTLRDLGNDVQDIVAIAHDKSGNDIRFRVAYSFNDDSKKQYTYHFIERDSDVLYDDKTLD
ncbi:hypothetical protein [Qiania dongpingensis]|uniref:Uncharacterized protein n=1 Tax=Qiania dongpingensis TaxID=2763669 RepID=A0A7G9G721_9FIRM|nr:hypothetical protein [Qiania dongpingensis]QNM06603.1 hypothetical protein H9Q78_05575 [Qiania dongpingensis]